MLPRLLCRACVLLSAGIALGQGAPRIALEWSAPVGCPDGAAVLAETDPLLAHARPGGAPLAARASIVPTAGRWRLRLEIDSRDGPALRELEDTSCLRLAQAAALSLAMAVDAAAEIPAPEPRPAPSPVAAPRFFVRVLLGGDLGSLGAPSPGPGLALGVFLAKGARLELSGGYWFPRTTAGVEQRLVAGGLHGCTDLVERPEVGLCLGVEGGRLVARSEADGRTVSGAWLALLPGAAVGLALSPWLAMRMEIDLGLTLAAPTLVVDDVPRGPASVFGRVVVGLEARF